MLPKRKPEFTFSHTNVAAPFAPSGCVAAAFWAGAFAFDFASDFDLLGDFRR
jgi:hypothetical protein